MPDGAFFVVLGHIVAAAVLGTLYFRRYRIARPPIGVFTLGDVAAMLVAIVVVPYLYLLLPRWLVAGLLGLAAIGMLLAALGPILGNRWFTRLATLVLVGADAGLAVWLDALHHSDDEA